MVFLGLHLVDWLVLVAYFVGLLFIGRWASKKIKNTQDFYQANRGLGKVLFSFLNFGSITSADQAAGVTREIFRQGLSGIWFQNLVLFITPFYWFSSILQRRARYIGPGDIFIHRFESRFLAGAYAVFILLIAIYGGSLGYIITGKTLKAIMVKPESAYTEQERQAVAEYFEFKELEHRKGADGLTPDQEQRYSVLYEKEKRGEIYSYASYLNLMLFYFLYATVIALYTIMGGLFAAVVTDVIQGMLIVFLSIILVPIGLVKVGGFSGLHARVPDVMFDIFGSAATSEYTWYFVAAMVITNLIGLPPKNFTSGGAARDDMSARMGMMIGSFAKRFMMVGWALTGLIAIGLYRGSVSDPGLIWGHMTRDLLGFGLIGLMLAAILAANMSSIDAQSLEWSAAFTKNIWQPLFPRTTEKTQVLVGRSVIFFVLMGNIYFATIVGDIFVMFKYVLSIWTIFGPSLWLVYFWRRLNTKAVVIQILLTFLTTTLLPNLIPAIPGARTSPALTQQTEPRVERIETRALQEDVEAGYADYVGQTITKTRSHPPVGIFFEEVVLENPEDPNSPRVGQGVFRVQLYIIHLFGVDLTRFSKPMLATLSFVFDIIWPFLLLFLVSWLTRPNSKRVLDEFYARIHTPALADPKKDAEAVRRLIDNPELREKSKWFPGTWWEVPRPTRLDVVGFVVSWLIVGVVIGLYFLLARVGA
jgi:SSS family solute:Na+ symporter